MIPAWIQQILFIFRLYWGRCAHNLKLLSYLDRSSHNHFLRSPCFVCKGLWLSLVVECDLRRCVIRRFIVLQQMRLWVIQAIDVGVYIFICCPVIIRVEVNFGNPQSIHLGEIGYALFWRHRNVGHCSVGRSPYLIRADCGRRPHGLKLEARGYGLLTRLLYRLVSWESRVLQQPRTVLVLPSYRTSILWLRVLIILRITFSQGYWQIHNRWRFFRCDIFPF